MDIQPYQSSGKGFNLAPIDQEYVRELRAWSREFFKTEIIYESSLFMTLNRVKEYIQNEMKNPPGYEREYDLVVKIEEVSDCSLKVTDTSNLPFVILCPTKPSYKSGDVLRITKCVKGNNERVLEAKPWTNFI